MEQGYSRPRAAKTMRERVAARRARESTFETVRKTLADAIHGAEDAPAARRPRPYRWKLDWLGQPPPPRLGQRASAKQQVFARDAVLQYTQPRRDLRARAGDAAGRMLEDLAPFRVFLPWVIEFLVAVAVVAVLGVIISGAAHKITRKPPGDHNQQAAALAAAQPPTPAPPPDKIVRIMVLGSDRRGQDRGFRTDVMMLVSVDARNGRVSVLSFPRDLVGKIPGYGDGRINTVMGMGGFEQLQGTFEQSYGARPDYYFLINFDGFVGLINSIGGIEVDAAEPLTDSCDLPQSRAGICDIQPGKHEMDGATALWYVRSRHSTSDFDRTRRAQEVVAAIFARMMDAGALTRMPELYLQYSQDVETNMSIPQMAALLPTAAQVAADRERITRHGIPQEITADWIMPDGGRVLLPDYEAVKEIVKEAALEE